MVETGGGGGAAAWGHRWSPALFFHAPGSFVQACFHFSVCFAGHKSPKLEPSCLVVFPVLGVHCVASSGQFISSFLHRSMNTQEARGILFVPE